MYEFLGEETTIDNLDKFQKNKVQWLQDNDQYSDVTKRTYWVIINNNIHYAEKEINRDLYDFTKDQITIAINSIIYTSLKTNTSLVSIVSNYINWAIENGYRKGENPCKDIDKSEMQRSHAKMIKKTYITLEEFFELLNNLKCSDIDKMLLVLARYGVNTQTIGTIKWDFVDRDNMVLNLGNDIKLPIDEVFLTYLDKAYKCETYDYKTSTLKYVDYGYIIKVSDKAKNEILNMNTLYTRINSIFNNNGMKKISLIALYHSRQYDFLFDILEKNRKVTYEDVREVLGMFSEDTTASKAQYLKERFTMMSEYLPELINRT